MMNNDIAIKVQSLSKVYYLYDKPQDRLKEALHPFRKSYHHDFYALNDINFEIKKGETVGIIGKNGAGKSTLLKIITGVLTSTSGSVEVNGKIASLLELGAGFNPEMTGMENIYLNGTIMGFSKNDMDKKVDSIIEFADIGEFIHQQVKTYSSGMFARLAFSVAINVEPDILIVDEVLSVGDNTFQKKCLNKLTLMKDNGVSILVVSHDDYTVKYFCKRALYLENGKQKYFGLSSEAVDFYTFDMQQKVSNKIKTEIVEKADNNIEKEFSIKILDVKLFDIKDTEQNVFRTNDKLKIQFKYEIIGSFDEKLTFVVNLYRHDDLYISGATSLMDNYKPFQVKSSGVVTVYFNDLCILSGIYKWRVAINDETGFGIFTEAVPVCEMKVIDGIQSVGMIHMKRKWEVK